MQEINFPPDDVINSLGYPIPNGDIHDVSVSLPTARDVSGFEDMETDIVIKIPNAYPRLFQHPLYRKLCEKIRVDLKVDHKTTIFAFPDWKAAEQCQFYAEAGYGTEYKNIGVILLPNSKMGRGTEFRHHAGSFVSSRHAQDILAGTVAPRNEKTDQALKTSLGQFAGIPADDVYLYPTGMAAIHAAYQALTQEETRTVQLGFPYVDTWKMQERFGEGSIYIPYNSAADLEKLRAVLGKQRVAAVFCEVPGNPLLRTIDARKLQDMLITHNVPLVIDDTLGPPLNIEIRRHADIIVTSLTKFASGAGNVMAGSLMLGNSSPYHTPLKSYFQAAYRNLLYPRDAEVLLNNLQDFPERMGVINRNAETLFDFLSHHAAVDKVYYTKGDASYDALRKKDGGYGGLMSFTLKDPNSAPEFYDALRVFKGPSLGMNNTLVCLYAWLAHWHEKDWAREQGIPTNIIRVSVGMENLREIVSRFAEALRPMPTAVPARAAHLK